MRITEKQIAKWFPRDRRFLHFCAKYYGYSFQNDEVVEHANFYAIKYINKMYHEGREFDDEKHMTGMVMSAFRFAILNGYDSYARTRRLNDRPMTDYEFEDGFNSAMAKTKSNDKDYDNTIDLVKAIIKELPPVMSEIIDRHYLQQQSLREIARDLEIEYTTARRWLRNGLSRIRKALENEEPREIELENKYPKYTPVSESLPKTVRSRPPQTNKATDSSHTKAMSFLYS